MALAFSSWKETVIDCNIRSCTNKEVIIKNGNRLVAWPSGLRRWFKAPVISMAWVRIPPLPLFFLHNLPFLSTFESISFFHVQLPQLLFLLQPCSQPPALPISLPKKNRHMLQVRHTLDISFTSLFISVNSLLVFDSKLDRYSSIVALACDVSSSWRDLSSSSCFSRSLKL